MVSDNEFNSSEAQFERSNNEDLRFLGLNQYASKDFNDQLVSAQAQSLERAQQTLEMLFGSLSLTDGSTKETKDQGKYETNKDGDKYRVDAKGQVTEFIYTEIEDPLGRVIDAKYSDIERDKQGEVTKFTGHDGMVYTKIPDNKNPFFPARDGSGWSAENPKTGEKSRSPIALGNVTIDKTGVSTTGINGRMLLGSTRKR